MRCQRCGYDNAEIMSASMKVERKQKELERDRDEAHRLHAEISQSMLAGQLVRDLLKERAERAEARVAVLEKAASNFLDECEKLQQANKVLREAIDNGLTAIMNCDSGECSDDVWRWLEAAEVDLNAGLGPTENEETPQ